MSKRFCYWINQTQDPAVYGGFVPSLVTENEPGHSPMVGDPAKHQAPWIWGQTLEEAERTAANYNSEMLQLSQEDCFRIVGSSMGAGRVKAEIDSTICPKCQKAAKWKHTHQAAHGIEGTHMDGSEKFECSNCGHTMFKEEGTAHGLKFVYD